MNNYPIVRQMFLQSAPVPGVVMDMQINDDGSFTVYTYRDNLLTIPAQDRVKMLKWMIDRAKDCGHIGISVYLERRDRA